VNESNLVLLITETEVLPVAVAAAAVNEISAVTTSELSRVKSSAVTSIEVLLNLGRLLN